MKCWILLCLTLLVIMMTGCASSNFGWKTETPVSEPEETGDAEFIEDLDPLSLGDEEIVVPRQLDDTRRQAAESITASDTTVITGELPDEELVNGYRVQLLATKNEQSAYQCKRNAMLKIEDHKVYLQFIEALYRVRVGDFMTFRAAQSFADDLNRRGFDTFVAQTRVDPRRAPDRP